MLTIATVQVGNYEDRGAEYLAKLFDGIRRNMPRDIDYRCVCLTDDPGTLPADVEAIEPPSGIAGWWNKLALFKEDVFAPGERVLYFDLDTLIIGDLRDFARYSGTFAALSDPYHPQHIGSAVMAWEAGRLDHVWRIWHGAGRPQFDRNGDQRFIESMQPTVDRWQERFPGQVVSYKVDCWKQGRIPEGVRVLCFHGHPRPHECGASFIKELWNADLQVRRGDNGCQRVPNPPLESAQENYQ